MDFLWDELEEAKRNMESAVDSRARRNLKYKFMDLNNQIINLVMIEKAMGIKREHSREVTL